MATTQVTTTSDSAPGVTYKYLAQWLKEAAKYTPYSQFATKVTYSRGMGSQIKRRRYPNLDSTPFTLAEGVPPAGKRIQKADILLNVDQYGDFIGLSDRLMLESADNMRDVGQFLLGRQAGEMNDQIARDILAAGTHALYAADSIGGIQTTGRTAVAGAVNAVLLDKLYRALLLNESRPWTSKMKAGTGVGTEPIAECWPVIVHPRVAVDLPSMLGSDFIPVWKYSGGEAFAGEEGSYRNFRFIRASAKFGKTWADSATAAGVTVNTAGGFVSTTGTYADVYAMIAIGQDAYDMVDIMPSKDQKREERNVEMRFSELGSGGTSDPLGQVATVGWKMYQGVKIKDQAQLYRCEVLANY